MAVSFLWFALYCDYTDTRDIIHGEVREDEKFAGYRLDEGYLEGITGSGA
jgi:hypothetical protein